MSISAVGFSTSAGLTRVSTQTLHSWAQIEDLRREPGGGRSLPVRGKGGKEVWVPLNARTERAVIAAAAGRPNGPIVRRSTGRRRRADSVAPLSRTTGALIAKRCPRPIPRSLRVRLPHDMNGDQLVVVEGPAAGRRLTVDSELWLGRSVEGPGGLEGDHSLDPHHARIVRDKDGRLVVEDLGAPGGTSVNGVTIHEPHALRAGDRIELGTTVIEVAGADAGRAETGAPSGGAVRSPSMIRRGLPAAIKGVVFPSVGLLVVQLLTGYLWLASGLTKVFRHGEVYVGGDEEYAEMGFVEGFEPFMRDQLEQYSSPGFFRTWVEEVVIPNPDLFAVTTIVIEIGAGVLLLAAGALWLFAWQRLGHRARVAILLATIVASVVATGLNLQLWLLYGADIPIALGEDPFAEAFGLDLYLPVVQMVLGGVALWTLLSLRRARRAAS